MVKLLFILLWPSIIFASQIAYVKNEVAHLYSDVTSQKPIGSINFAQAIHVGDKPLGVGTKLYYPTPFRNKIVFIKKEDLILKSDPDFDKFMDLEKYNITPPQKIIYNHSIVPSINYSSTGSDWSALSKNVNGVESTTTLTTYTFEYFYHKKSYDFGGGINWFLASDRNINLDKLALSFSVAKNFNYSASWTGQVMLSLLYSPTQNNTLHGYRLIKNFNYEFYNHLLIKLGLGFHSLELKKRPPLLGYSQNMTISGLLFSLGIDFRF